MTDYADLVKILNDREGDWRFKQAADAIEALVKERDEAREIWPEWASRILSSLKEHGYQYDADEEIQLPDDFIAHVEGWLQAIEDGYKKRAEAAEAEVLKWQNIAASHEHEHKMAAAEAARLREALQFYANEVNWIYQKDDPSEAGVDQGGLARAALEAKP